MKKIVKRFSFLTTLVALFALLTVAAFAADSTPAPEIVFTSETQLTVYVDGEWNAQLSDSYGFGDKATLSAPQVSGKSFSHWEADGSVISYSEQLSLTMNADTNLFAVYADSAPEQKDVAGFTSITRTNDGSKISFQAIASGDTAGILYSTTATGDDLILGGEGVVAVEAVKLTDSTETMPESVLDNNNCWMLQITPDSADTVYHARVYVTVDSKTTYSDVKDVKLSQLESGISLVANLEGFEQGINDELANLTAVISPSQVTKDPAAKALTYTGSPLELVTPGKATGGTMNYALCSSVTTVPAKALYSADIPTATDAGTYYVWYKVVGDENHTDSVPACVRVRIQEAKLTLNLNLSEKKILVGQSFTLTAKVSASGTVDKTVTWSSSKPKVATVSKKGVVKAVRAGSTVITATLANGAKAKCRVSVKYRYVYRCVKNGVYRITTNAKLVRQLKKEGWKYGKVFRAAGVSGKKVYWVYNKTTKRFRWTTNRTYAVRQKKAGNKAGLAFYASDSKSLPVYELCKEGKRPTYFYTMKASEVASMQKAGWKSKGIAFYSEPKALK